MLDGIGAVAAWSVFARQGEALFTRFADRRDNQADVARFRQAAARIGSVEELLRDRRTLTFVLEAFQLEGEISKTAVIRRLLTEDPANERSFANRMVDPRYREINRAFGGREGAPLADPALVERIVTGAMTNRFEKAAGGGNAGLREALYFQRKAATVTNVNELMADRAMTAVVRGALGLPEKFGLLDFEQQRRILSARVDFAQLQDPASVKRLVQRYLIQSPQATPPSDARLALLEPARSGTEGLLGLIGGGLSIRA
jgi:hypothetical protein